MAYPTAATAAIRAVLLTTDSTRIYIAGDTALYSDMALTGAHGIDVAIIPIGDNFTMGPDDALLALGYLKPKVVPLPLQHVALYRSRRQRLG